MNKSTLKPCLGRGKVVLGYLFINMGLCLMLDSNWFETSLSVIGFGFLLFFYGHIQHVWVKRTFDKPRTTLKQSATTAALMLAMVLISGTSYAALKPMEQIKEIDGVLKHFHKKPKTGELTAPQKKENETIKSRVLRKDFNLREMCRLSLDKQWNKMTPQQRNEFVEIFTNLLLNNAILHSEKHSGEEKIEYLTEEQIEEYKGRIRVKTRVDVPSEAVDFDVDYAMVYDKNLKRWRIYDLIIDEESLMLNYRDQFHSIISKHSYAYLVDKMKKKLDTGKK